MYCKRHNRDCVGHAWLTRVKGGVLYASIDAPLGKRYAIAEFTKGVNPVMTGIRLSSNPVEMPDSDDGFLDTPISADPDIDVKDLIRALEMSKEREEFGLTTSVYLE